MGARVTKPQPTFYPWGRRLRRLSILALVLAAAWYGVGAILGALYAGPGTLAQVAGVMPGVPVFPYATVAPGNTRTQRLMAVPLYLLRRQGVRVDAAVLAAPAEQADVVAWYRRMAPGLGWTLVGDTGDAATPRLVFLRGSEGLQLTIGGTVGHLVTPVQYVFLTGLPTTAIPDVLAAAPMVPGVDIARLTRPQPTPAPVPDVAPPSAPTPTPVVTPDPAPQPIASAEPERRTRVIIRRRPREAPPQPESTPRPESRPIARPRPETKREHDPPTPAAPEIHKPVVERPKTAERPDKPIVPPAPDGGGDAGTDGE